MITTTAEVQALCARLAHAAFVTVDTEFLRESTYYPQLCLIQVADRNEAACIDPLAPEIDLTAFWDLMKNEAVMKVFHAARQDLEIFCKMMGTLPKPLYDTQIAAMVCGFGDSVGYDNLIAKVSGVMIDKSSRFTDWSRRPLTDKQVTYALADVTHLRDAYDYLNKMITKQQRSAWIAEEMAILEDPKTYHVEPDEAWLRLKPRTTKPRFLAVLKEIAAWREQEAQTRNLPRGRVLKDESLEEIAAHPPQTIEDLMTIRGVSKGLAEGKMGTGLLAAVAAGVAVPADQAPKLPAKPNLGHYSAATVELLKVLLRHVCDEADVAPRLVANNSDLEQIASLGEKADTPLLQGWRRALFGEQALLLKQGKLSLAISPQGKVKVITLS